LALGTQTIGSIIRPAAFCGVIGYKPSYDRISRSGVIPLSPSLDHVGLFAANVADIKHAAKILIRDWRIEIEPRQPTWGVPEGPYLQSASEEGLRRFRSACDLLRAAGYEIKSIPVMPDFEDIRQRHNLIVAAEAARVHADWFAHYGDLYHSKTVELIRRGQAVSEEMLATALRGCAQLRAELSALMAAHQIDLWIAPATIGPAPQGLESTGDPVMNLPWTHGGLPAISVPCGTNETGLPLGLQIIGGWYQDEQLLAWAQEMERGVVEHVGR
jgi:Asp-tRNA(Asn)/Glu-tRNA(Gln) amidotransferase A subunit family amidase